MGEKSAKIAQPQRKVRSDKGIRLLNERDVWVLSWIAEQDCVRFDQLQRLLSRQPLQRNQNAPGAQGLTPSAVVQVLNRWMEEPAYVQYERLYVGKPGWIWLSEHGERLLNLPYTTERQAERNFPRHYLINEIRLSCEARFPEALWTSERDLCGQIQQGLEGVYVPSGELSLAERTLAIEVAQFAQSSDGVASLLASLLGKYEEVWYFSNAIQRGVVEQARQALNTAFSARVQLMDIEPLLS